MEQDDAGMHAMLQSLRRMWVTCPMPGGPKRLKVRAPLVQSKPSTRHNDPYVARRAASGTQRGPLCCCERRIAIGVPQVALRRARPRALIH